MSEERRTEDGGRTTEGGRSFVVAEERSLLYLRVDESWGGSCRCVRLVGANEGPTRFTREEALAFANAAGVLFGTPFAVEEAG